MIGRTRGVKRLVVACAGAAVAAGLCGCAIISEQYVLERQFTDEQVGTIRNGVTTKKEILERLGPPAAVARPGGAAADNVFQRFAATAGTATDRIAYRYDASALSWADLCAFGQGGGGCIPSTPLLKAQRLWILIDEASGRVVDHSLEVTEREEKAVEVRPWL